MSDSDAQSKSHREKRRLKMLTYGVVVSLLGLPIGVAMGEPVLWGLALCGLLIGGGKVLKTWRESMDHVVESSEELDRSFRSWQN